MPVLADILYNPQTQGLPTAAGWSESVTGDGARSIVDGRLRTSGSTYDVKSPVFTAPGTYDLGAAGDAVMFAIPEALWSGTPDYWVRLTAANNNYFLLVIKAEGDLCYAYNVIGTTFNQLGGGISVPFTTTARFVRLRVSAAGELRVDWATAHATTGAPDVWTLDVAGALAWDTTNIATTGFTASFLHQSNSNDDNVAQLEGVNAYRVDQTAPTRTSAAVSADGLSVVITHSEDVVLTTGANGYTIRVASNTRSITGASASGNQITLTLASAVYTGETVTDAYQNFDGNVRDTASTPNQLATYSEQSVTNGSTVEPTGPSVTGLVVHATDLPEVEAAFTITARPGAGSDFDVLDERMLISGTAYDEGYNLVSKTKYSIGIGEVVYVELVPAEYQGNIQFLMMLLPDTNLASVQNSVYIVAKPDTALVSMYDETGSIAGNAAVYDAAAVAARPLLGIHRVDATTYRTVSSADGVSWTVHTNPAAPVDFNPDNFHLVLVGSAQGAGGTHTVGIKGLNTIEPTGPQADRLEPTAALPTTASVGVPLAMTFKAVEGVGGQTQTDITGTVKLRLLSGPAWLDLSYVWDEQLFDGTTGEVTLTMTPPFLGPFTVRADYYAL